MPVAVTFPSGAGFYELLSAPRVGGTPPWASPPAAFGRCEINSAQRFNSAPCTCAAAEPAEVLPASLLRRGFRRGA